MELNFTEREERVIKFIEQLKKDLCSDGDKGLLKYSLSRILWEFYEKN